MSEIPKDIIIDENKKDAEQMIYWTLKLTIFD